MLFGAGRAGGEPIGVAEGAGNLKVIAESLP
jgi:hypothetical protein